jgi:predicted Zn-dependent protease with MMP-like domain
VTTQTDGDFEASLNSALNEYEALIERDAEQALSYLDSLPDVLRAAPEIRLVRAEALLQKGDPDAAQRDLERLVLEEPDDADAHYALGIVYGNLGSEEKMVEHNLRVRALDEALDAAAPAEDMAEYEQLIIDTAEEFLSELPSPFRERLEHVPVLLEARPTEDLVRDGFDPRALGLFEGPTSEEHNGPDVAPAPTRIVLYLSNLLDVSEDDDSLRDEIEITLLHEVGHYFGLEESDMERLGLA